jgi:glycosyltransferase involved in cell wall biosynthesis
MVESLSMPAKSNSQPTGRFGFNVIGYVSGNLGLGVTTRNIVSLLISRGLPTAVFDLDPGKNRTKYDLRFEGYAVRTLNELPYSINLFILPPIDLAEIISEGSSFDFGRSDRLNLAYVVWELQVLPERWISVLKLFEGLLAGSDFVRHTLESNLPDALMISAPEPVHLPEDISASREKWGLPKDAVVFVSSFDPLSDPARKNPFATVAAFLQALDENPQAYLLFKMNCNGKAHPLVDSLKKLTAGHPRILFNTDTLSYSEVLSLYASCDVFVSLHRAEGLGLGLMEAMALDKPVIATAWSGNMSFMNYSNSCLVPYEMVPVEASSAVYQSATLGVQASWAEPKIEKAAAWMRRLASDPDLRKTIGERAGVSIRAYQQRAKQGSFIEELRMIWEQRDIFTAHKTNTKSDVNVIRAALRDYGLPPLKRTMRRAGRVLNRHVLWRFHGQRNLVEK